MRVCVCARAPVFYLGCFLRTTEMRTIGEAFVESFVEEMTRGEVGKMWATAPLMLALVAVI